MKNPHIYTKGDIVKIGNTLVYFAERVPSFQDEVIQTGLSFRRDYRS